MLRHKNINRLCAVALAVTLLLTGVYTWAAAAGLFEVREAAAYAGRLFDTSVVHQIDIVIDDWDAFLETCPTETWSACSVVIDGKKAGQAGIRGKGNTSLSQVAQMDSQCYSFKIEFDHYQSGKTWHGLDKLCLNNLIQDATFMKDYLAYTLMDRMGVAAPLCAFAAVYVNGEYWGLYLAVEAVEDSFLTRNTGSLKGELYKPDSMSMGGGRGNGRDFSMSDFQQKMQEEREKGAEAEIPSSEENGVPAQGGSGKRSGRERQGGPGGGGMSSSDTLLKYIDDDPESYANIFDSAKTDIDDADQSRLIAALKALSEGDVEAAVDVEAVIRYFVVHGFLVNGDSYTGSMIHNYYLLEQDGLLSMIPWDYNLAFGAFDASSGADSAVNNPIDTPITSGSLEDKPMLSWIFADDAYTKLYHEIYREFMADVYERGWLQEEIERVAAMIDGYVSEDPTAFYTHEEFTAGVEALKTFCRLRCESVTGQLEGTIPATAEAQAADPQALIDAGDLDLSDMGSMRQGGQQGFGGRGGERGMGGGMPGAEHGSGDIPSSEDMGAAGGFPMGGAFPGMEGGSGDIPSSEDMGAAGGFPMGGAFPGMEGGSGDIPSSEDMGAAGGFPMGGTFPGMEDGGASSGNDSQRALLLTGGSLILLAAALIWARRTKLCR